MWHHLSALTSSISSHVSLWDLIEHRRSNYYHCPVYIKVNYMATITALPTFNETTISSMYMYVKSYFVRSGCFSNEVHWFQWAKKPIPKIEILLRIAPVKSVTSTYCYSLTPKFLAPHIKLCFQEFDNYHYNVVFLSLSYEYHALNYF